MSKSLIILFFTSIVLLSAFAQEERTGQDSESAKEWVSDKLLPNGALYEGPTVGNKANGKGTAVFPDGMKYVGEFQANRPDGYGFEYSRDGQFIRGGFWRYGVLLTETQPNK